jgi:hypothetical protein
MRFSDFIPIFSSGRCHFAVSGCNFLQRVVPAGRLIFLSRRRFVAFFGPARGGSLSLCSFFYGLDAEGTKCCPPPPLLSQPPPLLIPPKKYTFMYFLPVSLLLRS